MLAIFDCLPLHCPNCGEGLAKLWKDPLNLCDYLAGASHSCKCGFAYQYVETKKILESAQDLACYHS